MTRPRGGIRVVELALEIQGPYAALPLSEVGADVIKVENRVGGDTSRGAALSRMVADVPADIADFRHYFYIFSRGKRSVGLDAKSAGGRDVLRRLFETADVLASNSDGVI